MWKQQFTRRSNYAQVPALARQFAFHFIAIKLRTLLLSPQQLAGAAQGDCARRGAGRGAVQSRYRPLCGHISANHRGRCPLVPHRAEHRHRPQRRRIDPSPIAREPGGGVVQIPDSFTLTHREPIVRVIAHHCLPAVYSNNSHQVRSGHQPQGAVGLTVPSPSPPWNYHLDMVGKRAGGIPPGG